jgi:hypothetical protein
MNLELSKDELEVLKRVLKVYMSDLREEIYKTESHVFKPPLKGEEDIVKNLQAKLEAQG